MILGKLRHALRASRLNLPRVSYAQVIANEPLTLLEPVDRAGGLTLEELAIVIGIAKRLGQCRIFEIGSFRGRTTVNLAHNCPEAELVTFDLPTDQLTDDGLAYRLSPKGQQEAGDKERGYFFERYPHLAGRITRLFGDSAQYDFRPQYGTFDLVLIDGSHRYENVLIDSETALRLLRPDGGVVLWHDYVDHPELRGVVRAVHEIRDKHRLDIRAIKRTKFAYTERRLRSPA